MVKNVIQISLNGFVNIHLLTGEDGLVLVDTGMPGGAENIIRELKELEIDPQMLRLILITHGHMDHFGSAAALSARFDLPIAIHQADVEALRQGVNLPGTLEPTTRLMGIIKWLPLQLSSASLAPLEPEIIFEQGFELAEYGVKGQVLHTPGHTPGSCSVLLESGEVVVGDLVAGQLMRLLRRPGWPYVAADLACNVESLRQLVALEPHTFYLTHGGPFTLAAVRELLARHSLA